MSDSPSTSPPPGRSPLRFLAGLLLCIVAMTIAAYGFMTLVGVLDSGGYGTPAMHRALILLGVAGACLAAGVATFIWEIAKRFEPGARDSAS